MRRPIGLLLAALTAIVVVPGTARADAHADSLQAFERGKQLRDQGKYAEAAKEFKDAVDRERSVGGYYNLGLCYDRLGRYPEALKAYRQSVAIAQEKGDPRSKEALDAVQAVRARTHWVLVNVRDDIAGTPGLRVELDGHDVRAEDYGAELFSAGAEHTLRVSAKDYADLVVHPPDRQPFTVDKVGKSLVAPPEAAAAGGVSPADWGWQRWTGLALGVAGLGAIGYGTYTTITFINDKDRLQAQKTGCKSPPAGQTETECNAAVDQQYSDLTGRTTLGNVLGYGLGAALLAGGIVLFVVEPGKATAKNIQVIPTATARGGGGLLVTGRF